MTVNVKKYNIEGKAIGSVAIVPALAEAECHSQLVKDYIIAIRANARQWSANTKGRSEVSHTTKKPHAQKGTGGARQGSLAAPQYKGGGRVFGPKPKFDQHVRINQREKRLAIRALLAEKIQANRLFVLETSEMELPKTKMIAQFIDALSIKGKVLFLGEGSFMEVNVEDIAYRFNVPSDKHSNIVKSLRNIPEASFMLASNISGYDVIRAGDIVVTEAALKELTEWLV